MATFLDSINTPADHRALLRTDGAPCRVLGKRGILSQVAKEIPDLPPSFIGAVPVPTPDLTAKPPTMIGGFSPELPPAPLPSLVTPSLHRRHLNESQRAMAAAKLANMKSGDAAQQRQRHETIVENDGVEISTPCISQGEAANLLNVSRATVSNARRVLNEGTVEEIHAVEAGGIPTVSVSAAAEVARPPEEDQQAVVEADRAKEADAATAQARHMRRALEGALDHGTALLAALGLPMLVEPGFVPLDPTAIGDAVDTAIDHAIATLDALDAAGVDLEDDGTAEPSLGWIDGKPVLSDSHDDREAEDDDEPILGAPERHPSCYQFALCEPSLGAPEVAFGRHEPFRVDQTHWAGGGLSDLELNDIDKPADLDGLHEQFAGTGLVPALDWTAGGYVG